MIAMISLILSRIKRRFFKDDFLIYILYIIYHIGKKIIFILFSMFNYFKIKIARKLNQLVDFFFFFLTDSNLNHI